MKSFYLIKNPHVFQGENKINNSKCYFEGWYFKNTGNDFSISFIPFMECNHAILSMKHEITGFITINNKEYNFNNSIEYIEKDYGCSFPTSYIWAQSNNFKNQNASFFLSIATIPLSLFSFRGFICSLIVDNKEYRFATYNGSKIIKYNISQDNFNIKLKNKDYLLHIYSDNQNSFSLKAPRCGSMEKEIYESIDSNIYVCLSKNDNILFEDTSKNSGLEIVL